MRAIDLYSGIGGWTLGMKLSGIQNVRSFEWWSEANDTHNFNFGSNNHEIDIRKLNPEKEFFQENKIDFVVGSPPCTQFSYSNKGGGGDLEDGLKDIYKFLEVVRYLRPTYWAMENVPRVSKILEFELNEGSLIEFRDLVKVNTIVDISEYGLPQKRKRMIAGNFPFELFNSYKQNIETLTLGDVLNSLSNDRVIDPNFNIELNRDSVTELDNEPNLNRCEVRMNSDSKVNHPIYNKMSFPDSLDRPSRTITATCTKISRESIIVSNGNGYRRLNVRERGVLQGFPITFQFLGKSTTSKFKMIGNAIPPVLTYYIFQSMLEVNPRDLTRPQDLDYEFVNPDFPQVRNDFGPTRKNYSRNRKFKAVVPDFRFGSGVRFELSNSGPENYWSFKFFYGNSKKIFSVNLDNVLYEKILSQVRINDEEFEFLLNGFLIRIREKHPNVSSELLQLWWIDDVNEYNVYEFLDSISIELKNLVDMIDSDKINFEEILTDFVPNINRGLLIYSKKVVISFLFLSRINEIFFKYS